MKLSKARVQRQFTTRCCCLLVLCSSIWLALKKLRRNGDGTQAFESGHESPCVIWPIWLLLPVKIVIKGQQTSHNSWTNPIRHRQSAIHLRCLSSHLEPAKARHFSKLFVIFCHWFLRTSNCIVLSWRQIMASREDLNAFCMNQLLWHWQKTTLYVLLLPFPDLKLHSAAPNNVQFISSAPIRPKKPGSRLGKREHSHCPLLDSGFSTYINGVCICVSFLSL